MSNIENMNMITNDTIELVYKELTDKCKCSLKSLRERYPMFDDEVYDLKFIRNLRDNDSQLTHDDLVSSGFALIILTYMMPQIIGKIFYL